MRHIKELTLKITESTDEDKTREIFTPWSTLFNLCTKKNILGRHNRKNTKLVQVWKSLPH